MGAAVEMAGAEGLARCTAAAAGASGSAVDGAVDADEATT